MNSTIPLIILLSSNSNYVIRMIYLFGEQKNRELIENDTKLSEKRKIQVLDSNSLKNLDYEKFLINDEWLIIQNCQITVDDGINDLENLIDNVIFSYFF